MQEELLSFLRCPVTRTPLRLQIISTGRKWYNDKEEAIVSEAILWADADWFYPVIDGIPRMIVEACIDYHDFFQKHLPEFASLAAALQTKYGTLIRETIKKNKRTKQSFEQEWKLFNPDKDKTWNADNTAMLNRFLLETGETSHSLDGKLIFDAGCGNGILNVLVAKKGATILGMDFSKSIEKAFERNTEKKALFIQGDVQFPPVAHFYFDIVHSSGVLIHTPDTELSFSRIDPCVKEGGKLSVWLYHPRKNFMHNLFNQTRKVTSRLPVKLQYYLYLFTLFPAGYVIKRLKGNRQNKREMMIDILDWFSPQYRWEHEHDEVAGWFKKRNYKEVNVTTDELFGFNMTGVKKENSPI